MTSKKKVTPFQKAHELIYAVKEVSKDARDNVTVRCLFCTNTLDHHFDHDNDTYEFFLSTEIVEVIIGDLFFRADEQLEDIDDDEQNAVDAARKKLVKKQNEKKNAMKPF
ncbi:unnamed protein product [Sphagnum troendelagicum]